MTLTPFKFGHILLSRLGAASLSCVRRKAKFGGLGDGECLNVSGEATERLLIIVQRAIFDGLINRLVEGADAAHDDSDVKRCVRLTTALFGRHIKERNSFRTFDVVRLITLGAFGEGANDTVTVDANGAKSCGPFDEGQTTGPDAATEGLSALGGHVTDQLGEQGEVASSRCVLKGFDGKQMRLSVKRTVERNRPVDALFQGQGGNDGSRASVNGCSGFRFTG